MKTSKEFTTAITELLGPAMRGSDRELAFQAIVGLGDALMVEIMSLALLHDPKNPMPCFLQGLQRYAQDAAGKAAILAKAYADEYVNSGKGETKH